MRREMLRPKDLMVGDWVILRDPDTQQYKNVTITWGDLGSIIMNWFQPIKLTDEIMKNNFPPHEEGYEIGWWENSDESFHIEFIDYKCEIVIKEMNYVHELQHLLKLVGKDKTIIL